MVDNLDDEDTVLTGSRKAPFSLLSNDGKITSTQYSGQDIPALHSPRSPVEEIDLAIQRAKQRVVESGLGGPIAGKSDSRYENNSRVSKSREIKAIASESMEKIVETTKQNLHSVSGVNSIHRCGPEALSVVPDDMCVSAPTPDSSPRPSVANTDSLPAGLSPSRRVGGRITASPDRGVRTPVKDVNFRMREHDRENAEINRAVATMQQEVEEWQDKESSRRMARALERTLAENEELKEQVATLKAREKRIIKDYDEKIDSLKEDSFKLKARLQTLDPMERLKDGGDVGLISEAEKKELQKQIQELEALLKEYEKDNKRLHNDLRTAEIKHKDIERRMFVNSTKLSQQLGQLQEKVAHDAHPATFDEVKKSLAVEEKLRQQQIASAQVEEELRFEIERLRKDKIRAEEMYKALNPVNLRNEAMAEARKKIEEAKHEYNLEISELQHRLRWYIENQELVTKDAEEVNQLRARVKELEAGKSLIRTDHKRYVAAEKENSVLREELAQILRRKHPDSVATLLLTNKKTPEEEEKYQFLQDRVKKLEAVLEEREEMEERRVRSLRQEHERIKQQYETKTSKLQQQLNQRARALETEQRPRQLRVKELKDELDRTRTFYQKKIQALTQKLQSQAQSQTKAKAAGKKDLPLQPSAAATRTSTHTIPTAPMSGSEPEGNAQDTPSSEKENIDASTRNSQLGDNGRSSADLAKSATAPRRSLRASADPSARAQQCASPIGAGAAEKVHGKEVDVSRGAETAGAREREPTTAKAGGGKMASVSREEYEAVQKNVVHLEAVLAESRSSQNATEGRLQRLRARVRAMAAEVADGRVARFAAEMETELGGTASSTSASPVVKGGISLAGGGEVAACEVTSDCCGAENREAGAAGKTSPGRGDSMVGSSGDRNPVRNQTHSLDPAMFRMSTASSTLLDTQAPVWQHQVSKLEDALRRQNNEVGRLRKLLEQAEVEKESLVRSLHTTTEKLDAAAQSPPLQLYRTLEQRLDDLRTKYTQREEELRGIVLAGGNSSYWREQIERYEERLREKDVLLKKLQAEVEDIRAALKQKLEPNST